MNLEELEALLADIETRVDRLRALYEQYFQGVERLEPLVAKKEVERRFAFLRKQQPRNTALRFRMQQLIQKYTTYQTYWQRVARQIEEGTYRRDVLKARRRREEAREQRRVQREADRPSGRPGAWDIDIDVDADAEVTAALGAVDERTYRPPKSPIALPTSQPPPASVSPPKRTSISPFAKPRSRSSSNPGPAPSQAPGPSSSTFASPRDPVLPAAQHRTFGKPASGARPAPPVPSPAPQAGRDGVDIKSVYDRYIEAKRRNNERTDNVRYETIERNIKEMLPKLEEKHRGKRIDFEVVVKDGKVGLKPIPK